MRPRNQSGSLTFPPGTAPAAAPWQCETCKGDLRRLGHAVMDHLHRDVHSRFAGDEEDPAPILLEHLRQVEPAQPGPAEYIDLEETQPILVGDLEERLRLEDAEVVHQDVHHRHVSDQQVHAFLRAEVRRYTRHLGVMERSRETSRAPTRA